MRFVRVGPLLQSLRLKARVEAECRPRLAWSENPFGGSHSQLRALAAVTGPEAPISSVESSGLHRHIRLVPREGTGM